MSDQPLSKIHIRRMFLDRRMQFSPGERKSAAERTSAHFFKYVPLPSGAIVAGYWPIRGELDDLPILTELLRRGHTCALPHVPAKGMPLEFRAWDTSTPMIPRKYGIAEPVEDKTLVPDIILVPMASFDTTGHRLGYGGGFYDRTIAHLKGKKKAVKVIGLAYEVQRCDTLPAEKNDVRMDLIVTDRKIYQ